MQATPNTASGEATITIAGSPYTIRFGMNVMRDFTKMTGQRTADLGVMIADDFNETMTAMVACAVRRHVPAAVLPNGFSQDDAGDLLDGLSTAENDALAEAFTEAVSVGPLMAALMAKVAAKNQAKTLEATTAPSESGTTTSNSDSAN